MKLTTYIFIITALLTLPTHAQNDKQYKVGCIAFYNIENLFDTINQPGVIDEEFLPESTIQWNTKKYFEKLDRISEVISKIGTDLTPDGPAIIGLSEIENRIVLDDLVAQEHLRRQNYQIVHYDGPDLRGVDCALLYNPKYFTVTNSESKRLIIPGMEMFFTRDQLVVSGMFDGEMMHFIVNHWPSRRSGQKKSEPLRMAAAQLTRSIVDSLLALDPNAKVIVMGDMNDDPKDKAIRKGLNTVGVVKKIKPGTLFNPMESLYRQGIGSLAYRDSWTLFDQIILTPALIGDDKSTYTFYRAGVFNKPWLIQKEGAFKGYPWRTFAGGVYLGGYSDHFPVYIYLIKEKE